MVEVDQLRIEHKCLAHAAPEGLVLGDGLRIYGLCCGHGLGESIHPTREPADWQAGQRGSRGGTDTEERPAVRSTTGGLPHPTHFGGHLRSCNSAGNCCGSSG